MQYLHQWQTDAWHTFRLYIPGKSIEQMVRFVGAENASYVGRCGSSAMICGQVEEVDPPREQEDPGLMYYEEVACDMKQRENSLGTTKSWKLAERRNLSFSFLGNVSNKGFALGLQNQTNLLRRRNPPSYSTRWYELTFVKGCKDAKTQRRNVDGLNQQ